MNSYFIADSFRPIRAKSKFPVHMLERIGSIFRCGADGLLLHSTMSGKPGRLQLENMADGGCFPYAATDGGKHALPVPHWLGSPGNDHPHYPRKLVAEHLILAHRSVVAVIERSMLRSLPSVVRPIYATWTEENQHFAQIFKMAGLFTDEKDASSSIKPSPLVFKEAGLPEDFSSCSGKDFMSFLQISSNFFCGHHKPEQDLVHAQVAAHALRLRACMMYFEAKRMAASSDCSVYNRYHWFGDDDAALFAMAAKKDIYVIQRKITRGVSPGKTDILIIKLPGDYERKWDFLSDIDVERRSRGLEPLQSSRKFWKFRRINQYTDALAKISADPSNVILGFTGNHFVAFVPS